MTVDEAAQALGISRSTLNERVHKYGLVATRPAPVAKHVVRRRLDTEEDDDEDD